MGFRDLQRYESQKPRYDKYKAWLALDPAARQAAYATVTDETKRVKTERETGYVSPFGTAGTTKVFGLWTKKNVRVNHTRTNK